MKNKTPLFTLVFFVVLGTATSWTPLLRFIVVINSLFVLFSTIKEIWGLIKNG